MPNYRNISKVIPAIEAEAAPGFRVKRTLPNRNIKDLSPFLVLDHFGPITFKPNEARGVEEHPHRGFETITFMFEGFMEHRDSNGKFGLLGPGGIQWMTAGSGIIHSELPPKNFVEQGGTFHGVQLWINLPSHLKMTKPTYQDRSVDQIPVAIENDGLVRLRVIAGAYKDVKSTTHSHTPLTIYHIEMNENQNFEFEIPETFNAFVQVTEGEGYFGENSELVRFSELGAFDQGKQVVRVQSKENKLKFLFISGQPIDEPIFSYGPFVMNTEKEIYEAIHDYQNGKMGTIPAEFITE